MAFLELAYRHWILASYSWILREQFEFWEGAIYFCMLHVLELMKGRALLYLRKQH